MPSQAKHPRAGRVRQRREEALPSDLLNVQLRRRGLGDAHATADVVRILKGLEERRRPSAPHTTWREPFEPAGRDAEIFRDRVPASSEARDRRGPGRLLRRKPDDQGVPEQDRQLVVAPRELPPCSCPGVLRRSDRQEKRPL